MLEEKDIKTYSSNARHQYEVQKGRVSPKTSRDKKMYGPPQDESWIWLTTELLCSDAWRSMSINCYKLIFHLLIEHSNHAARENGRLLSTYGQLQNYGLTRNKIRPVIVEAEFLGLIKHRRGRKVEALNQPNSYRLTFYADDENGYATNDWKSITKEKIEKWRMRTGQLRKNRENYKRNFNTGL
ncbi:hypothetical protein N9S51_01305 [Pelagibacteraceae bacterium]|nr:hypothetical protein [Pelagibacteraceae bacterium]